MMKQKLRVLNLEDNPKDSELIQSTLAEAWAEVELIRVDAKDEFISAIEQCKFDIILGDYALPDFDGITALLIAKEKCPDTPYIFVSGVIGEESAIETLKKGAVDYVLKNRLSKLVPAVKRALQEAEEIVSRKKVEIALKTAKKIWEQTFDSIADGISIHNKEYEIIRTNKSLSKMLRIPMKELIGKKCYEVFHGLNEPMGGCPMKRIFESKNPEGIELFEPKVNRWLAISCYPVFDDSGDVVNVVHIVRDVTERKKAEAAIKESEEKFRTIYTDVREGIVLIDAEIGFMADFATQSLRVRQEGGLKSLRG